jgi:hypothetical protein
MKPSEQGGEWEVCDGRKAVSLMPEKMLERFRAQGLNYRRRFIRGLDVPWEQFFKVNTLQELRDKMEPSGHVIDTLSEQEVMVSYRTHAVLSIPERGVESWFNQILLHHPAALPAEAKALMSKHFSRDNFPRTVCFGDGEAIPDAWIEEIGNLMNESAIQIQPETDDVLLVNNLLLAHGRLPYVGDRQIRVALGDMRTHVSF